jgi:hypothetical protein
VKLRQASRVGREGWWQEFQRDLMIEAHVVDEVDLAHPTASEQTDDPIAIGQQLARTVSWSSWTRRSRSLVSGREPGDVLG